MRTNSLRTAAGRALALLGVLAAIAPPIATRADDAASQAPPAAAAATVSPPAPADAAPTAADTAAEDRIAEARVEAGFRVWDADDNKSLLFPYDPLSDGPVFGLKLLYLTPAFGTLDIESSYRDDDAWFAEAEYHRGATLDLHVLTQKSALAREHEAPLPDLDVPNPNIDSTTGLPYDAIETESRDAEPGADYALTRQTSEFALKFRVPDYPAHLRASGRVTDRGGTEQLNISYRSCGTHVCHTDSRPRDIDQRTEEFSVGGDAHLGPVDLAYTHTRWTYRDRADDPVDYFEDAAGNLMIYPATGAFNRPGEYVHAVNPDIDSYTNLVKLNTNLANRTVLSLSWRGENQENESAGITRETQRAEGAVTHTFSRELFASLRLAWQREETADLSDEARQQRLDNNRYHSGQNHQHVVEPDDTRSSAEAFLRWNPLPHAQIKADVSYTYRKRDALIEKEGNAFVHDPTETRTTAAGLSGRYRFGGALTLDATIGQEWTSEPEYANENTSLTRFGAGATWVPSTLLTLQASYQGYRGENDDDDALGLAYDKPVPYPLSERTVDGNAFSAAAVLTPSESVSLTASWMLNDNGVDQDLILGAFSPPGFAYASPDTDWSGRTQTLSLRASWAASKRLTLTAEGMWIDGREYYEPTFPEGEGLEEIGTVEFTKWLATLTAEARLTERIGLTVSGNWADYDDQVDDGNDGSALGLLAAVSVRW